MLMDLSIPPTTAGIILVKGVTSTRRIEGHWKPESFRIKGQGNDISYRAENRPNQKNVKMELFEH